MSMTIESSAPRPVGHWGGRWTDKANVAAITLFLLLGASLRLLRFLQNRSLWYDEAMFARNIIEKTPLELVGSLSYAQHSPSGFTVLVKLLTIAFGERELVLRLTPLLAGLASLALFYLVARRWLPRWGTILALGLFAVSDVLAEYAGQQFEKYSSDATLTLVILLVGLWFHDSSRWIRYPVFAIVGAVAVWFSYPSAIVLAGVGLTLFFLLLRRKAYREALLVVAVATCWLASAAAMYSVSFGGVQGAASEGGGSYWGDRGGFLAFPPITMRQVDRNISTLVIALQYAIGFVPYGGALLLYGLGAIDALRRGGTRLFLVAPVLVTIVLSSLHLYPIYQRLILFLVPLLLLTVVIGIVRISESLTGGTERVLAFGLLLWIVFQPIRDGLARGLNPRELQETRPLMMRLSESYLEGDGIALYYSSVPAYYYYAHLLGFDHGSPAVVESHMNDPEEYCSEVGRLPRLPRVWILFSHVRKGDQGSEQSLILDCLDAVGRRSGEFEETGASLYLYDLRGKPSTTAPGS
jgi:hypothetical protein